MYWIINPRELTADETAYFSILESMTEKEYSHMVEAIRQTEFPHMPRPPDTS